MGDPPPATRTTVESQLALFAARSDRRDKRRRSEGGEADIKRNDATTPSSEE